jgi:probable phosphoglycerate mutase
MSSSRTTTLFAVRHGETEWNLAGRQQGHLDSPLTQTGIEQAHALADSLLGRGIEVIYSSDLGRAAQTAAIIGAKLDLSVTIDRRLRERDLGLMQGKTRSEFREQYPEEFTAFASRDPDYVPPGGESARQRLERSVACCVELAARYPDGTILIVTHGGVLMGLLHHTLGIPLNAPRRFSLFNAAVNSFSVCGDSWRLNTWGDISHLRGTTTLDHA